MTRQHPSTTRHRLRALRSVGLLSLALLLMTAGTLAGSAVAVGASTSPPATPSTATAVQSASGPAAPSGTSIGATFGVDPGDSFLCPDCDPGGGGGQICPPFCNLPTPGCNATLVSQSASRGDNPELGGPYSHVQFSSKVSCTGGPTAASVQAQLWDRTAGGILKDGSTVTNTTNGTSSGTIDLYDVDYYPAAQQVEQILVFELVGPAGWSWNPCGTPPGSQILWCDGVGTSTLDVGVGWMPFPTGIASPSFYCSPSVFAVDDPPTAERPTKVVGVGTLRCSSQANIDLWVTLFFSSDNGVHWVQVSQQHTVFYDVPQNTAKQLSVEYACGETLRSFGWWQAELNYKADNRSGSGYPAAVGPAVLPGTQYLYNVSC